MIFILQSLILRKLLGLLEGDGEIGELHKFNPIKDFCPVCPNCHLILHTKIDDEYISID